MGNLLIVTVTIFDRRLHTPMYFFLRNLSIVDLCFITGIFPNAVLNSLINHNSFLGCAAQVFLVVLFQFFYDVPTVLKISCSEDHDINDVSVTGGLVSYSPSTPDLLVSVFYSMVFKAFVGHLRSEKRSIWCMQTISRFNSHKVFKALQENDLGGPIMMLKGILQEIPKVSTVREFLVLRFSEIRELQSIPFLSCVTKVFLVVFFGAAEYFILMVMSFDHYTAICLPLRYDVVMNRVACGKMAAASWLAFSNCLLYLVVITLCVITCFYAYVKPPSDTPSELDLLISVFYIMCTLLLHGSKLGVSNTMEAM
ncbi:olfactory receptor 8B8-like [Tachyglossus aculeatus]|uniref:olfactory receptor 8B8-like n=1 Tax=Tachyglossus aculeatus TaxID=9261 RepID=UPI0018F54452|nr:olfactory receptor 8B8-like [Tachyglossus aculeatus]